MPKTPESEPSYIYTDNKGQIAMIDVEDCSRPIQPEDDMPHAMTYSELHKLRCQLARCFSSQFSHSSPPASAKVDISLSVSPHRKIKTAQILSNRIQQRDPSYQQTVQAALAALQSPECKTLDLPLAKYNLWKDIIVTFDAVDMLAGNQRKK